MENQGLEEGGPGWSEGDALNAAAFTTVRLHTRNGHANAETY